MTYESLVQIGLLKSDVVDTMAWGTPALKRKKRFMLRLGNDGEHVVIRLDWLSHDRLLAAYSDVLYKTGHYDGYPAVLARLELLSAPLAQELIDASWEFAPVPDKRSKE